jgi:hypothetical protein
VTGDQDNLTGNDARHDGSIDHPQSAHSAHSQLRVKHGSRVPVGAHLARADRVIDGLCERTSYTGQVSVRHELVVCAGREHVIEQTCFELHEGRTVSDGNAYLHSFDQRQNVVRMSQISEGSGVKG